MSHPRKLTGNRFEGFYSINRRYADIVDRKKRGMLQMLTRSDVESLESRLEDIVETHRMSPQAMKPYNVAYPERGGKLIGLNFEDTEELRDLANRLSELLVSFAI